MLLSTLLSLSLAATTSDTLVVKTAQMEGPYTLYTPFVTDSLNMKGQAIDPNEALNKTLRLSKLLTWQLLRLNKVSTSP